MKRQSIPRISLKIAGGAYCITVCAECYEVLRNGGKVVIKIVKRNQEKYYAIRKAQSQTSNMFFEVCTRLMTDEEISAEVIQVEEVNEETKK